MRFYRATLQEELRLHPSARVSSDESFGPDGADCLYRPSKDLKGRIFTQVFCRKDGLQIEEHRRHRKVFSNKKGDYVNIMGTKFYVNLDEA